MSPSLKALFWQICGWTLGICLICLVLAGFFWPEPEKWRAMAGIGYGSLLGLAGLYMICSMAQAITDSVKTARQKAALQYTGRYFFYAAALFAGAFLGLPPLAMLAGILCSKLALAGYSLAGRKDTR